MLWTVSDEGHAIHYSAVETGTDVCSSDGTVVGTVHQVVDNYREHILDGIVIETPSGDLRFADGPEVARTAERLVTLAIDSAAVAELPPPDKGIRNFRANVPTGRLGKMFGRGWKRD